MRHMDNLKDLIQSIGSLRHTSVPTREDCYTHTHKDNKENRITQLMLARVSVCNELTSGVVKVAENWYLSKGFENLYVHKNCTRKKAVFIAPLS